MNIRNTAFKQSGTQLLLAAAAAALISLSLLALCSALCPDLHYSFQYPFDYISGFFVFVLFFSG